MWKACDGCQSKPAGSGHRRAAPVQGLLERMRITLGQVAHARHARQVHHQRLPLRADCRAADPSAGHATQPSDPCGPSACCPHFMSQLRCSAHVRPSGWHTAAPARRLQGSIQPLRRARAALAGRAPGSRASSPGNLRVPSKRGTAPCGSSSRRRPPPPAGRGAHSRRAWRGSPLGRTTQAKRSGPASAATQPTVRHPCSSRTARQDGRRPRPTLCPAQGLPAQGARPPRHAPPRLMPQALARRRLCRGLAGRAAPLPAAPAAGRPHGLNKVRPPAQRPRASARPACRPCPAAPAGRRGADP